MTDEEIQEIIQACRIVGQQESILIPELRIDRSEVAQRITKDCIAILTNQSSIMAAKAIARANKGMEVPNWEAGRVMCISEQIIKSKPDDMTSIGVIVHETGHAYNLAAGLVNTEANAQVFEIQTLLKLSTEGTVPMEGNHAFDQAALDDYLAGRMKNGFFTGKNFPGVGGYEDLHSTLRSLPKTFVKTHAAYVEEFASHEKSQASNPKFAEAQAKFDKPSTLKSTTTVQARLLGAKPKEERKPEIATAKEEHHPETAGAADPSQYPKK